MITALLQKLEARKLSQRNEALLLDRLPHHQVKQLMASGGSKDFFDRKRIEYLES